VGGPRLEVVLLHPQARLPVAMTAGAAGLDLHACLPGGPHVLAPGGRAAIPTGLAIAVPPGFEGQVRPRSGLARDAGVTVLNAPGTIDADYRGELQVLLVNLGSAPCTIASGERIAQLVIAPVVRPEVVEVHALVPTARGADGFGSTGR